MFEFDHFIFTGVNYFMFAYDRTAAYCRDTNFLIRTFLSLLTSIVGI